MNNNMPINKIVAKIQTECHITLYNCEDETNCYVEWVKVLEKYAYKE